MNVPATPRPVLPTRARPAALAMALAAALVLTLAGCSKPPEKRNVQPPVVEGNVIRFAADSPQKAVLVSAAVEENVSDVVRIPGRLAWDETRTVRVFAPLAGRITRIAAEPGQAVQQGAVLALLSSPELGQAQTEARRAEADAGLAEKNVARLEELHKHGIVALKELQAAQAELERASAERSRAAVRLKQYGAASRVDQEFALRAPLSGVVVERNANPGQEVRPDQSQPGSPALFVVSDPGRLWVQLDAPESAVRMLHKGSELSLRPQSSPDIMVTARIEHIADFVDPQTRTVRLRASVDNAKRLLKAEGFVMAEITVRHAASISAPATAVLLSGSTEYVFVDEGNGVYRRVEVEAEEAEFGRMRIAKGLAAGQKVVTEGGLLLLQIINGVRR
jgi:cobalt-zinc-cadmium efflux system membrane fusion protein